MFRKNNYVFNLIAAILFGAGGGITAGFWCSPDTFIILCIAAMLGLLSGLIYLSILLFPR